MTSTALRSALLLPVAALAVVLAPAAQAQSASPPETTPGRVVPWPPNACESGYTCVWSGTYGSGKKWKTGAAGDHHVALADRLGKDVPARSVYNNFPKSTKKVVTFFAGYDAKAKKCRGSSFTLGPGHGSGEAGGAPMGSKVLCFRVP
ncbi:peptidase inhibitor family I36 protein [Saccharothrix algeriensis]|uniref:Peptidase inhibitor family I36 protein n=1 Tax=Saccharothrix algeriensis TaxID=173560 RepID=A0A8T8I4X2_9PSEU|nr:peptidase inhibitor family I36 protein [Saccharothrix algeriensis]MBM7812259.1 hypothetical protein [Saccharothrix algeriensis]QTR05872.1 peptidase inhibitor family I36 protein [Saccharothrix algeriensis]